MLGKLKKTSVSNAKQWIHILAEVFLVTNTLVSQYEFFVHNKEYIGLYEDQIILCYWMVFNLETS